MLLRGPNGKSSHGGKMKTYHPMYGKASYIEPKNGIFYLDDDFYAKSGGIFRDSPYYNDLVK